MNIEEEISKFAPRGARPVLEIIEKFYPREGKAFEILVLHSMAVSQFALLKAKKHPELAIDEIFVYEAAMLHDIGVFLTSAETLACYGKASYIQHGVLGADLLRKEGLFRHALVCERHTGVGLSKEEILYRGIALPEDRSYIPISLEEQLICYADCFFSKTSLAKQKSVEEVRRKIIAMGRDEQEKVFARESLKRWDVMHRLFD